MYQTNTLQFSVIVLNSEWTEQCNQKMLFHKLQKACAVCRSGIKDKGIHTNEKDREGDEEKKYMRDEVEGVHEAAIVQDSFVHAVGITTPVVPTERQGHVT